MAESIESSIVFCLNDNNARYECKEWGNTMDKLRAMQYLLKVADTLSFSRAAKSFGVPASSISRRISDLEVDLGVELLHRTTRTVRLTEIGMVYVEKVRASPARRRRGNGRTANRHPKWHPAH